MMQEVRWFPTKGLRFGAMTEALRSLGVGEKVGSFVCEAPRAISRGALVVAGGCWWILEGDLKFHKEMRIALIFFFELAKSTNTDFVVGTFE